MRSIARTVLSRGALSVLVVLGLLAGFAVTSLSAAAPAAAETTRLSGAYRGGLAADAVQAFGQWRGRRADVASDFLPGDDWAGVQGPSWLTGAWSGRDVRLVLGVPMLVGPKGSTTLAQGATGAYNAHFAELGRNLVAEGLEDTVLRLGWEMNGNWFSWSQIGQEAAFTGYWRQIVTTMRAVPGARFAFDFNPTLGEGSWGVRPDAAWPGDAYVDVIGLNVYDSLYGNSTATPQQRWASMRDGAYGLDWWAAFARAHGDKPLGFPEWGLWDRASQNGGGGGDNPFFMTSFLTWMASHHVLYDTYFDVHAHDGNHRMADFPLAAAAYRAHFAPVAPVVPAPVASAPAAVATAAAPAVSAPAVPAPAASSPAAVPSTPVAPAPVLPAPSQAPAVVPTVRKTSAPAPTASPRPTTAPRPTTSTAPTAAPSTAVVSGTRFIGPRAVTKRRFVGPVARSVSLRAVLLRRALQTQAAR